MAAGSGAAFAAETSWAQSTGQGTAGATRRAKAALDHQPFQSGNLRAWCLLGFLGGLDFEHRELNRTWLGNVEMVGS